MQRPIHRPIDSDAPPWCEYFFSLAPDLDLISAFINNKNTLLDLMHSIPDDVQDHRYAKGKWTIKEVFIHLLDTERFYCYRALCSSRKVDVDLEYNQEDFATHCNAEGRTLKDIALEFASLRDSTITLFSNMTDDMLDYKGFPDKMVYTARSLGWMVVGHSIHHTIAIREKYLFI